MSKLQTFVTALHVAQTALHEINGTITKDDFSKTGDAMRFAELATALLSHSFLNIPEAANGKPITIKAKHLMALSPQSTEKKLSGKTWKWKVEP